MKAYTMELVRKEMGQCRSRLRSDLILNYVRQLEFAIPQKYLDNYGHFCIGGYILSENGRLNIGTGFGLDGCNYDEYNYMASLAIGKTYELVFVEDLTPFGTWFVLDVNDD